MFDIAVKHSVAEFEAFLSSFASVKSSMTFSCKHCTARHQLFFRFVVIASATIFLPLPDVAEQAGIAGGADQPVIFFKELTSYLLGGPCPHYYRIPYYQ
jgi:hypothetical protein